MIADALKLPFPQPPHPCLRLHVKKIIRVNRGWARIVLGGADLARFTPTGIACWVKVFIPGPTGNIGRTYTVRRFDAAAGELEINVVRRRHTNGMSQWIYDDLRPGAGVYIAGPRGGYSLDPTFDWHVFLGDETALPAIYCLMDALPAQTPCHALVEVPFPENTYLRAPGLEFLIRGIGSESEGSYLEVAMETLPSRPGRGKIWIAGEASLIRRLKKQAAQWWCNADVTIQATGYWKAGYENYRDETAFADES